MQLLHCQNVSLQPTFNNKNKNKNDYIMCLSFQKDIYIYVCITIRIKTVFLHDFLHYLFLSKKEVIDIILGLLQFALNVINWWIEDWRNGGLEELVFLIRRCKWKDYLFNLPVISSLSLIHIHTWAILIPFYAAMKLIDSISTRTTNNNGDI